MDLGVLVVVLLILPFVFGCDLIGTEMNSLFSMPNIMIQNGSLHLNWNFQNDISDSLVLQIASGCVNNSADVRGLYKKKVYYSEASSIVLRSIQDCTLTTHCEVCIVGYKGSNYARFLNTKVVFSFDAYCANRYYNISSSSQTVSISQGEGACFVCTLPGQSRSDIWEVNGQDVAQYSNAVGALIVANTSTLFGDPTMTSTLTCGTKEYNMTVLIIYAAPSSPLNLSVSTVPGSPNQLSASWPPPIPKNGIINAYTVYCNTSSSQAYPEQVIGPNAPTVRSVVNETTMAVIFSSGLRPYTQYNCYVTANTSVGEGTPSQIVVARTDQSTPSSPLNLSVSTVPGSPNQLSASWSPPIPKNGIITAYTVYCNTSAIQAFPEHVIGSNVLTVRSVVNGITTAVIFHTGLNPYTQYNCFVTANTSVGEGTPSQIVVGRTDQSIPGPVSVLEQIGSTFTTVTLMWLPPIVPNGAIIGYEVILGSMVIYNTSSTQATLSGLTVSMSYNLSVVALTVKGSGQPTYLQATTSSIPPVSITLLQPLSSTAVRLFWNVNLGVPQDIILGFVVYFHTKLSVKRQSGGVQTQSFPPNATTGDLSGLVPNYNDYEFSVQAMLNISGQPTVLPPQSYVSLSSLTILTPAPMDQIFSHTTITGVGATLATLAVVLLILMVVAVIVTILVMWRKGNIQIKQYNISVTQPDDVTSSVIDNNYTKQPT